MKRTSIVVSLALVAASLLIGYQVYAHCGKCAADGKKIAAHLDQNKTTLAKAVTAAEQHSKGRAISVTADINDKDQVGVHVFCIVGEPPKIMKCHFDTAKGAVSDMKEVTEFPNAPHAAEHEHGDQAPEGGTVKMIKSQPLEVACGSCIYKMAGVEGCHLAVMIDGKPYLVQGATWPNHDFCDTKQQAVVSGKLEGGKFIATKVEPKK